MYDRYTCYYDFQTKEIYLNIYLKMRNYIVYRKICLIKYVCMYDFLTKKILVVVKTLKVFFVGLFLLLHSTGLLY